MTQLDYRIRDRIAVITFANPPVNSISTEFVVKTIAALERAAADAAVDGIVLTGQGGSFSAGADIKEFATARRTSPTLRDLIAGLDDSPKPVVAAIEGVALGGGLELAMGCHFRVASSAARIGLPEVKLGLIPGAGGTQRLPRLIGVEAALNVMLSGEPLPVKLFKGTPLLDAVVDGAPLDAAIDLARKAAAKGAPFPRARDRMLQEPNLEALCQFARNTVKTAFANFPAPLSIIDAVEAAGQKSFDAGTAKELRLFLPLLDDTVSKAMRHAFFAERAAAKIPDVPRDTATRNITTAAVIGSGTMGTGIALCFANAGIPVQVLDVNAEALERGFARIREFYDGQVKKGRIASEDLPKKLALVSKAATYEEIRNVDVVVEAVFEDMAVKETVFKTLDKVMKPGAILASNTSTLDINAIAAVTQRPGDVIGTHFFSPANVMKLLEVVRGKVTAKDVLATTMQLAKTLKKTAVLSGVCDGFIGNRMIEQYSRQAFFMLDEGATPQQVDAAIEKFGFAMGPFRMSDLAGNDIGWHIRKRRYVESPKVTYSRIGDKLCELGRLGQKTNAGWYDYKPGDRAAYPSQVVDDMVLAYRAAIGIKPRKLDDAEIVDRLVYSLVNEAAYILEEKIAQRASDVDVVYLTGYGFPLWRGGPLQYADSVGLYAVVQRMKHFAANPYGDLSAWVPAPLLAQLAASGGTFNDNQGEAA